jgi:hypothetical protein
MHPLPRYTLFAQSAQDEHIAAGLSVGPSAYFIYENKQPL